MLYPGQGTGLGPNTRAERGVDGLSSLAHGLMREMVKVTGQCCDGSTASGSVALGCERHWRRRG